MNEMEISTTYDNVVADLEQCSSPEDVMIGEDVMLLSKASLESWEKSTRHYRPPKVYKDHLGNVLSIDVGEKYGNGWIACGNEGQRACTNEDEVRK